MAAPTQPRLEHITYNQTGYVTADGEFLIVEQSGDPSFHVAPNTTGVLARLQWDAASPTDETLYASLSSQDEYALLVEATGPNPLWLEWNGSVPSAKLRIGFGPPQDPGVMVKVSAAIDVCVFEGIPFTRAACQMQ